MRTREWAVRVVGTLTFTATLDVTCGSRVEAEQLALQTLWDSMDDLQKPDFGEGCCTDAEVVDVCERQQELLKDDQ